MVSDANTIHMSGVSPENIYLRGENEVGVDGLQGIYYPKEELFIPVSIDGTDFTISVFEYVIIVWNIGARSDFAQGNIFDSLHQSFETGSFTVLTHSKGENTTKIVIVLNFDNVKSDLIAEIAMRAIGLSPNFKPRWLSEPPEEKE